MPDRSTIFASSDILAAFLTSVPFLIQKSTILEEPMIVLLSKSIIKYSQQVGKFPMNYVQK